MKLSIKPNLRTYDKKYFEYVNNQGHVGVHALSSFYKGRKQFDYYSKDMLDLVSKVRVNTDNRQGMNYFYTPNTMKCWKRGTREVIGLNSCWVDVDTQKVGISNERLEFFIPDIVDQLPGKPKCIVHSGHGYYFLFPYKYQVIARNRHSMITLWQLLENTIVKCLDKILNDTFPYEQGACDKGATDVSRLLRLQGSVNYKKGKLFNKCKTIWMNDDDMEYTMFDLCDAFLPPYDPNKTKRLRHHPRNKQHLTTQIKFSQRDLKVARNDDFKQLLKLRDNDLTGYRNNLLFLVACNSSYYKTNEETVNDIEWFNNQFTEPLPYRELRGLIYRVIYLDLGNKYSKIKNYKIIQKLEINEQEQRKLSTIINKDERYRRNNLKRNKKRHANSQRKKTLRNNKVIKLYQNGLSKTAISKQLNISRSTVMRVFKGYK